MEIARKTPPHGLGMLEWVRWLERFASKLDHQKRGIRALLA